MSRSVRDPDYQQPAWQGYCWPSLGEPCGQCHRCTEPTTEAKEPPCVKPKNGTCGPRSLSNK